MCSCLLLILALLRQMTDDGALPPFEDIISQDQEKQGLPSKPAANVPIEESACSEGIVVPLDLPEFRLVAQEWQKDGSLRLTVMAVRKTALCPHCQRCYHQIHDCWERVKRDLSVREHQVNLIVLKRRFRCPGGAARFFLWLLKDTHHMLPEGVPLPPTLPPGRKHVWHTCQQWSVLT